MNNPNESCAAHEDCTCSHPCGGDAAPAHDEGTPAADVQAACLRNLIDAVEKFAQAHLMYVRVSEKTLPILPIEVKTFAMMARSDFEKAPVESVLAAFGAYVALNLGATEVAVSNKPKDGGKPATLTFTFVTPDGE